MEEKPGKEKFIVTVSACPASYFLNTFCPTIICHFLVRKLYAGGKREEFSGLRIFTLAAVHTVYNHYYLCRLNPQLLKRSHKELLLPSLIFICIRWQMKTFQFLMSSWLSSALE